MYSFKRLITTVTIIGMFGLASFAQGQPGTAPRAGQHAGRAHADHLAALTKALKLSDAQVTSIREAVKAERPALKTMAAAVKAKRQALKSVADAASPNPAAVGNAFLALRASEANMKAGRQKLQAEIRNVLTPDQQKTMSALRIMGQARYERFRHGGAMSMGS